MPKPVPLPRSIFMLDESSQHHQQSAKKVHSGKKINLRPLKEVFTAADYQLLGGSIQKKPNQSTTEVSNLDRQKAVKESSVNKSKSKLKRPMTLTSLSLDSKRLQTDSAPKVKKCKTNFIQRNKNIKKLVKETPKVTINNGHCSSANSKDSDKEFSVYEKLCNSYKPSPLTKLCHSLDVSELENTVDVEANNCHEIIDRIKQLIRKEEQRHRRFVTNITGLLGKLENSLSNKENSKIDASKVNGLVNSGYCSPLRDLRQNIFHKSIAKKLDYNDDNSCTKMQRAVQMYNHLKEDCNFLCTPKPNTNSTPNTITRRSLSARLQEQCLLLAETPKP